MIITSGFWHTLAAEFRALPGAQTLRADWHCAVGGKRKSWKLVGGSGALHFQFEALARRAALQVADANTPDLLIEWLEAVRQASFQTASLNYYAEQKTDATDARR